MVVNQFAKCNLKFFLLAGYMPALVQNKRANKLQRQHMKPHGFLKGLLQDHGNFFGLQSTCSQVESLHAFALSSHKKQRIFVRLKLFPVTRHSTFFGYSVMPCIRIFPHSTTQPFHHSIELTKSCIFYSHVKLKIIFSVHNC